MMHAFFGSSSNFSSQQPHSRFKTTAFVGVVVVAEVWGGVVDAPALAVHRQQERFAVAARRFLTFSGTFVSAFFHAVSH